MLLVPIFFETKDKIIWFAISKIENKYLAFPKSYIKNGIRIKGKSYAQWFKEIPDNMKKYYTYCSGVGENVFLIPEMEIDRYFSPLERAMAIKHGTCENTKQVQVTRKLIKTIENTLNIPIENIGIDGSTLLGNYSESSDVDILIYGKSNADIVQQRFFELASNAEINLFCDSDLTNKDVPKTIFTTGFGKDKETAFKQFLRRYYGYIEDKRFSICCVPKKNEEGYIQLNRNLKKER